MATEFLTTKEIAALLRIKERKVYDLAASGELPCSKAMGKLLFPRDAIDAWLKAHSTGAATQATAPTTNVFLGSHDPLLEWALRESQCGIATYFDGSMDGLRRFSDQAGIATGLHLYDDSTQDWNVDIVRRECGHVPVVLIHWAMRRRGLVASKRLAGKIRDLGDIVERRVTQRQTDAGAQVLFNHLLGKTNIAMDQVDFMQPVRTEADAVLQVVEDKADVCFGLEALAVKLDLGFVPIIEESFDLLIHRHAWFEPSLQSFDRFCRSTAFQSHVAQLSGYDVARFGEVRYNAPV